MTSEPKAPMEEALGDRVKRLLGEALLREQKNENAFGVGGREPNRRALIDAAKSAWKAYDDALEELIALAALAVLPTSLQRMQISPPPPSREEVEDVLQRLYRLAYIDGHSDAQYPDGDCDGPVIPVDGVCISDGWRNCRAEFLNLFKEARHDG